MKKVHTSVRLKEIMTEKCLKQVDVLNLAKPFCIKYGERLGKNDLSQYVAGKTEPGQRKLFILGKALGVNPSWLMGLDVPKENEPNEKKNDIISDIVLRLRSDDEFRDIVTDLYNASTEQLNVVKAVSSAFKKH